MRTVFISYSHIDEAWKKRLLPHLQTLEQAGVEMKVWHDRKIDGGDKWYPEIQDAMANAAVAVLLISADFLASGFCVKEEVPFLLDRQEKQGMLLIPVLIRKCPWKAHRWLADRQMIPRDGKCVAIDFPGDHADGVFTEVAESILSHFKQLSVQPQTASAIPAAVQELAQAQVSDIPLRCSHQPPVPAPPVISPDCIDLTRLPETGSALFGRDEELKLLDAAWVNNSKSRTRVLAFTANGGVGKSTLINHWLGEMKRDNFRGATRVFGWSFYSQGVREQGPASADTFVNAALKFFGDEAMAASPVSAWDKGERLARLAGAERALLVLDGMEPLQSAQAFDRGKLRDPALESLLRGLAKNSAGLCLISTRESIPDLANKSGFVERDLEQITPQAGRALLRTARVIGTDAELESLADRFGPHALAISLLGVYLHEQPGHGVGPAQKLEQMPGKRPVDRVLAGFEQWLGDSAEREALHLLGLFDRPADAGCLKALRAQPTIVGLTDRLAGLGDAEWDRTLTRLEKLQLIHTRQSDSGQRFVDAHPLIREHFAAQLREKNPEAWCAAHRRLYEHLCATTQEGDQPTLEDLQPLYQAVIHGCRASIPSAAFHEVFLSRIRRGYAGDYPAEKLGAVSMQLSVVHYFFKTPWSIVAAEIPEAAKGFLLNDVAFNLRSVGRPIEAIQPTQAAIDLAVLRKEWTNAATGATNLSELQSLLGDVGRSLQTSKTALDFAVQSNEVRSLVTKRATFAMALLQCGKRDEAITQFQQAEALQFQNNPEYPFLFSIWGWRYCNALLAEAERRAWCCDGADSRNNSFSDTRDLINQCRDVAKRAQWALQVSQQNGWLTIMGLDHLTLGRAALYSAIFHSYKSAELNSSADTELVSAVSAIHHANALDCLPPTLLTYAWLRRVQGRLDLTRDILDEAWEITERGPMKLHMADIHLYRARLFFREKSYPWKSPQDDLAAAEKLINDCGYHRRDEELADAKKAILRQ